MKDILKAKKGNIVDFAVSGIIGFIVVAVILYVGIPILGGVATSTTPANATASWGAGMAAAQANATSNIGSGANLMGIAEIVIPAVVILGVLLIGLVHKR